MADEETNEVTEELQTESAESAEGKGKKAAKKAESERQDITTLHERTIAAMSYFGFLAIVPFYLKKDSEFCRFHGKQGLLLAIVFFMSKLFTVLDLVMDAVLILQVVVMFRMGFAALSGRWKKVPYFYDWSCQLEAALTLKTKEEELDEVALKPEQLNAERED
ncbi:MAG: hypothetical protein V1880_00165 [Patescibacteria group bacterium]